jgi:hypothetical protein
MHGLLGGRAMNEGHASPAPRRKLTLNDKLTIMVRQTRCPVCGEKLGKLSDTAFDHEIALGRGGADELDNIRAIHHKPCHALKSHGNGYTTRGSDIGEIAKTRRLEKSHQEYVSRLLAKEPSGAERERRTKPKAKIRSRGFPKRARENRK